MSTRHLQDQNIVQRSGRYEPQPSGYRAFIPAPLPPNPPVQMTDDLQALLSRADRALGRLDGSIQTLPDPDLFVFMYVRREAVLSSQIEGTQSSLQDVLNAEANIFVPNRPGDVHEVINYVNAMNYGLERLQTLPLSTRLIREIHERLMQGVRGGMLQPGELRRSQNWIGPAGCTLNEATYIPPPPHEVPNALGELEKFLHASDRIAPLLRIGMAHAQFEAIHPLSGRKRSDRQTTHHVFSVPTGNPAQTCPLSFRLSKKASHGILRTTASHPGHRRLGGLARVLFAGRGGSKQRGR